jgi:hypothetical protein
MIGARDRNLAGLERLAQRIERARLELRNYVAVSARNKIARQPVELQPCRNQLATLLPG